MNTNAENAKTTMGWNQLPLNSNEYATAACMNRIPQIFCASWTRPQIPAVAQYGQLKVWSPTDKTWSPLGDKFSSNINQMCADQLGNIYMAGDTDPSGNAVLRGYNVVLKAAFSLDTGYKGTINYVGCDAQNFVYVTGNFFDSNGNCPVLIYSPTAQTWTPLSGGNTFTTPLSGMCVDTTGRVYVLSDDGSINFWNTVSWSVPPGLQTDSGTSAIACDNSGTLYYNTSSTIYSLNIGTGVSTNLKPIIPTFSGTTIECMSFAKGILYFGGYGFTDTTTTSSFVLAYESAKGWTTITPSNFNTNNATTLFDVVGYQESADNYLLLVSNLSAVYDGKDLNF